jgi:hypothetical protein
MTTTNPFHSVPRPAGACRVCDWGDVNSDWPVRRFECTAHLVDCRDEQLEVCCGGPLGIHISMVAGKIAR